MTVGDDDIVTNRDLYVLMQEVGTRTTELMHQVDGLTQHVVEDRHQTQDEVMELLREVGRVKSVIYAGLATGATVALVWVALGHGRVLVGL